MKKTQAAPAPLPTALLAAALRAQDQGVFIARRGGAADGLEILFANEVFCSMTGFPRAALRGQLQGGLHGERTDVEKISRWQQTAQPGRADGGVG